MSYLQLPDGEKLFYRDMGMGFPVILIHGWPVNSDMWEYQIPTLLEQGFRVIAYDRRGFGRSSQPASDYSYQTLASDLKELINKLELQQCSLVGFSMGGGEIARYLSLYGNEKISRVVLVSSVVPYMLKDQTNPAGVDRGDFDQMLKNLKEDRPHFLAQFTKQFYGESFLKSSVSNEILQWTLNMAMMASPVATMACVKAFSETDFRSDLEAFRIPILFIHGTSDKTVPLEVSSQRAVEKISGALLKTYEAAPHGLFVTHKKELTADICAFLQGQDEKINEDELRRIDVEMALFELNRPPL